MANRKMGVSSINMMILVFSELLHPLKPNLFGLIAVRAFKTFNRCEDISCWSLSFPF